MVNLRLLSNKEMARIGQRKNWAHHAFSVIGQSHEFVRCWKAQVLVILRLVTTKQLQTQLGCR